MKHDSNKFILPFYEYAGFNALPPFINKLLISLLLGLGFFFVHFWQAENEVLALKTDFSWVLGLIIFVAMLSLYYATHTLKTILPIMVHKAANPSDFITELNRNLSSKNFIISGVIFALLNCAMAYLFDPPYASMAPNITIFFGYFIAGFICGMAVWGIYGAMVSINQFSRDASDSLDGTAPDKCGGTLFLGEALIVFGSVTLIVGVLISAYILNTWPKSDTAAIAFFKVFWLVFPYLMSATALIAPALEINKALRQYKIANEQILHEKLTTLTEKIEHENNTDQRDVWREQLAYLTTARANLFQMRTWPYGFNANLKYAFVLMASVGTSVSSTRDFIKIVMA